MRESRRTEAGAGRPSGARRSRRRPPEIRLRLLGAFALHADGARRVLPRAAQRLVALLALRGSGLTRAEVAVLLAPHLEPESASRSLRTALSRLNASGLPVVERDGASLRLTPAVEVDVDEVERIVARISGRRPGPVGEVDPDLLTRPLLAGWAEEWVLMERQRLLYRCLNALDLHARALAAEGEIDASLEAIFAALRADPLRESTALVLIEVFLSQANAGAARSAYLQFHERSVRELDLEPSEELQDLVAPLLRGRPALRRGPRIRRRPRPEWLE